LPNNRNSLFFSAIQIVSHWKKVFSLLTFKSQKLSFHSLLLPWLQLSKISLRTVHFSLACNDMVFLSTIKYMLLLEWQCHWFIVFHPCTLSNLNSSRPCRETLMNDHRCQNVFINCWKPTQFHNQTKYIKLHKAAPLRVVKSNALRRRNSPFW
jgi:hypothetical protein